MQTMTDVLNAMCGQDHVHILFTNGTIIAGKLKTHAEGAFEIEFTATNRPKQNYIFFPCNVDEVAGQTIHLK